MTLVECVECHMLSHSECGAINFAVIALHQEKFAASYFTKCSVVVNNRKFHRAFSFVLIGTKRVIENAGVVNVTLLSRHGKTKYC